MCGAIAHTGAAASGSPRTRSSPGHTPAESSSVRPIARIATTNHARRAPLSGANEMPSGVGIPIVATRQRHHMNTIVSTKSTTRHTESASDSGRNGSSTSLSSSGSLRSAGSSGCTELGDICGINSFSSSPDSTSDGMFLG